MNRKKLFFAFSREARIALGIFLLGGVVCLYAKETTVKELQGTVNDNKVLLDTVWTLIAAFLVFWMQAGFAMVEAGFSRAKNVVNLMMKNLMDFCFGSISYWAVGFAIMFGAGNAFMGLSGWFLHGSAETTFASLNWTPIPLEAKYLFQLVFAATAATIVSGAMAERTKFTSYLVYSIVISALIYPIIGHWIWGGGWLAEHGMWDFAGSTVVHSTGGWLALAGAIMLGPRIGKYASDGTPRMIPGHSIILAALGTFILWLGWFGFNPGSTMAADLSIAHIAVTTNLSGAAGAIAAIFLSKWIFGKFDGGMALNGALAGLVAITAGTAFVGPRDAILIGVIGGVLVVLAVIFIDRVLKVDDPVGAISVHGVCGVWGTLAVGLFAQAHIAPGTTGNGLFYGGGWKLLSAQLIGVVAVFSFAMVTGFTLFGLIKVFLGLRVSKDEEYRGLDIDEHGMEAYAGFQIFMTEAGGLAPMPPQNGHEEAIKIVGGERL